MNKEEQMNFVLDHARIISHEICLMIAKDRIPKEFDGHEFRVLLSDKFKDSARMSLLRRHPHSKRNKDFQNWKSITSGV